MNEAKDTQPQEVEEQLKRPIDDSELEKIVGGTDADSGLDSSNLETTEEGGAVATNKFMFFNSLR